MALEVAGNETALSQNAWLKVHIAALNNAVHQGIVPKK